MRSPIRLSVVMTHPIQYYAPWFRDIAANVPDVQLTVHYCVTPTPKQQGVGFDEEFTWDESLLSGYDHEILRRPARGVAIHSSSFLGVAVPEIVSALRKAKPDVVMVPGWYSISLVAAAISARLSGLPVLYRGDSKLSLPWRGPIHKRIRTWAMLDLFTHYLSVGRKNHEFLRNYSIPESKIFFSPHCVDNAFFEAAAENVDRVAEKAKWNVTQNFVILFAGKFDEQKRPWDVIEAAGQMHPPPTVIMAGSGEAEERCREAAKRSSAQVIFAGFRNQEEIAQLYAIADCLVLPSESETWGLVVNEALAAGVPCIVSADVGCAPDLIEDDKTGFVVPVGDVAELTRKLTRIRDDFANGHDFGQECRARVALYSFEAATAGLHAAILNAVEPGSTTRN